MAIPQYPIGNFSWDEIYSDEQIAVFIEQLAAAPKQLRKIVGKLSNDQLDTPYREGSWTIRQLVHHIADASMNGYIRIKLALSEDTPSIKPYKQDDWAEDPDSSQLAIAPSLVLLEGLMAKWVNLLRNIERTTYNRAYYHPEDDREVTIREAVALYDWHIRHHIAQIEVAIKANQWQIPEPAPYITGLGGIFFKSPGPENLKAWYKEFLGLESDQYGHLFRWRLENAPLELGHTQWSVFSTDGSYMNPSKKELMINYRVKNLDGLLEHLRTKGAELVGEPESFEYGRFAWVMDPDGNKIELWEPIDQPFADL